MKKFDLEAAKAGAPIITREGKTARFIALVPECDPTARLIVHLEGCEECDAYGEDGRYLPDRESSRDLFMKPQKRIKYINLRYDPQDECKRRWFEFDEKGIAERHANEFGAGRYIAVAVPLEIEE